MRRTVLIDAPSNLGLRPPAPGTVPGCYKLAGALREQGLLRRLGALEGGVVVPPRYDLGDWKEGDGDFNAAALAAYTGRLATRVEGHVSSGDFPVVLGGDCSILLGAVLALRRLGRYGVAYLDGHGDFRHPGNAAVSGPVGAAAGEGLAQITGRGQADLTDLDGLRPYVRDEDVCVLGIRDVDEDQEELTGLGISHAPVGEIRRRGPEAVARDVLTHFQHPRSTASGSISTRMSSTRPSCRLSTAPTPAACSPVNSGRCWARWPPRRAAPASTSPSTTRTATRKGPARRCSPISLRVSLRNPDLARPQEALCRPALARFHGQQGAAAAEVARSSIARQPWPRVCDAPP